MSSLAFFLVGFYSELKWCLAELGVTSELPKQAPDPSGIGNWPLFKGGLWMFIGKGKEGAKALPGKFTSSDPSVPV